MKTHPSAEFIIATDVGYALVPDFITRRLCPTRSDGHFDRRYKNWRVAERYVKKVCAWATVQWAKGNDGPYMLQGWNFEAACKRRGIGQWDEPDKGQWGD